MEADMLAKPISPTIINAYNSHAFLAGSCQRRQSRLAAERDVSGAPLIGELPVAQCPDKRDQADTQTDDNKA